MGDRTWVHIFVANADADAAREVIGNGEDEGQHDDDQYGFQIMESNYGGSYEREGLQKEGIPYTGDHGAGGNYGEMAFAFDGEIELEESTADGETFVVVDSEGKINTDRLSDIRVFHEHVKKAEAAIKERNE
jgi:hypothetical protein